MACSPGLFSLVFTFLTILKSFLQRSLRTSIKILFSLFFFNITVLSLSLWSSFIFSGFSKDNPHLFVLSTPSYLSVVLSIPFSTFCMIIRTERTLCYFSPSVTENGVEAKTLMPLICRRLSSSSVQLLLSVFLLAVCVLGIIIICSRNSCG